MCIRDSLNLWPSNTLWNLFNDIFCCTFVGHPLLGSSSVLVWPCLNSSVPHYAEVVKLPREAWKGLCVRNNKMRKWERERPPEPGISKTTQSGIRSQSTEFFTWKIARMETQVKSQEWNTVSDANHNLYLYYLFPKNSIYRRA